MNPANPAQSTTDYTPSDAAREASSYYNALPLEEKAKLAPLLEHYRDGRSAAAGTGGDSVSNMDARVNCTCGRRLGACDCEVLADPTRVGMPTNDVTKRADWLDVQQTFPGEPEEEGLL